MIEVLIVCVIFCVVLAAMAIYLGYQVISGNDKLEFARRELLDAMGLHSRQMLKKEEKHGKDLEAKEREHHEAMRGQLNKLQLQQDEMRRKLSEEIEEKQKKYNGLFNKHKSQQVRMGHIMEKIAPLLETFPVDVTNASVIPLFDTVDYLVFVIGDEDESKDGIYFVEIKTGNGDLSSRQRKVRNLINAGRVHFITFKADRMEDMPDESKEDAGTEV